MSTIVNICYSRHASVLTQQFGFGEASVIRYVLFGSAILMLGILNGGLS